MNYVGLLLENVGKTWLEVAPWLLVGLVLAGLLKRWIPATLLDRWLGGRGVWPVLKAAVIGTPLPLCSCSVLPTAIQLHRSGASTGSTVSFLVATPENGADSITLSYVLLGPVMTIIRPLAAIVSAVLTGLLTEFVSRPLGTPRSEALSRTSQTDCCSSDCCATQAAPAAGQSNRWLSPLIDVFRSVVDLLDDLAGWLLIGIVLAASLETLVPADMIARWGSGILPMLGILLISIPMYICATASTPVAATLLAAGVSPGTVLVFLLAGPATNLASAGLLHRELGLRATVAYLAGIAASSVGLGLLTDLLLRGMKFSPALQVGAAAEWMPLPISLAAAVMLGLLAIKPLRRLVRSLLPSRQRQDHHCAPSEQCG